MSEITVDTAGEGDDTMIVLTSRNSADDVTVKALTIGQACDLFARLGEAVFVANGFRLKATQQVRADNSDWLEVGTEDDGRAYLSVLDDEPIQLDVAQATDTAVYLLGHATGGR